MPPPPYALSPSHTHTLCSLSGGPHVRHWQPSSGRRAAPSPRRRAGRPRERRGWWRKRRWPNRRTKSSRINCVGFIGVCRSAGPWAWAGNIDGYACAWEGGREGGRREEGRGMGRRRGKGEGVARRRDKNRGGFEVTVRCLYLCFRLVFLSAPPIRWRACAFGFAIFGR